jgi:MoxR-like ATPase
MNDLENKLHSANYIPRPAELLALRSMIARQNGARVLVLEGAPGTGKTSLGRAFAQAIGAEVVYYLCHHWTTEEEMFLGVDVGRVAAGVESPDEAYRPGFLLRAAEASRRCPVVVIIDELDKAPERSEALLLEFLQTGRVHGPRGEVWQADLSRLFVFVTTNGLRPLMEPTLRRGFRLRMEFLPPHVEQDLLRKWTGAPTTAIRVVVRMANTIRAKGATAPSVQEMRHLLEDMRQATSASDAELLLRGWLVKESEDWDALTSEFGAKPASVLWGEWKRGS